MCNNNNENVGCKGKGSTVYEQDVFDCTFMDFHVIEMCLLYLFYHSIEQVWTNTMLGLAVGDAGTNGVVSIGSSSHFGLGPMFKKSIGGNILNCIY